MNAGAGKGLYDEGLSAADTDHWPSAKLTSIDDLSSVTVRGRGRPRNTRRSPTPSAEAWFEGTVTLAIPGKELTGYVSWNRAYQSWLVEFFEAIVSSSEGWQGEMAHVTQDDDLRLRATFLEGNRALVDARVLDWWDPQGERGAKFKQSELRGELTVTFEAVTKFASELRRTMNDFSSP